MKNTSNTPILLLLISITALIFIASDKSQQKGSAPTTINDFFLPGSQPLESGPNGTFTNPSQCDNCHIITDEKDTEPVFNWQGSMMAQAQRDPLYLACLAIANQDAPESGDLCIRCHTPKGWLEGRSEPTDASVLTADDREGITCHFCHRMIAPTAIGTNPYPDDPLYVTQPGNKSTTYTLDQNYLPNITEIPPTSANGMYIADDQDNRRGPYFDPQANHDVPYSPFHSESAICGTCHDVSNPVFDTVQDTDGNLIGYQPNDFDTPPENASPYALFPVERTYSEWIMSDYNTPEGITGTYFGGNKSSVSTCQDCHMRDVTGHGCDKNYAPLRDDLPLHDMTGGNTFIPTIIDSVFPGEANLEALDSAIVRARDMLQHAATMELTVNQLSKEVIVKVTNETGHKLPSGYPEGRRIWINVKAFNSLTLDTYESGAYNFTTAELETTDTKIYYVKPGLSHALATLLELPAGPSFHFVLSDTIYFDNRIPPRGFTNANFEAIQSPPVGYTYEDEQYWDETVYDLPFAPDSVNVTLYYQTTTKGYVEFLRDENVTNDAGLIMYNLWNNNGKSTPEVMNNEAWSGDPVQTNFMVDLKVFLEGPFNLTEMTTSLNQQNRLPLSQPFNKSPWYYSGEETVLAIPNENIVDWLLIELRHTIGDASTAVPSTIIGQQAVFLMKDGLIMDIEGDLPEFDHYISDNLYIVIWHRNHLGIMSASSLNPTDGLITYDYTTSDTKVYGNSTGYKEISTGIWGMIAADADANGTIDFNDKVNSWMLEVGLNGYLSSDLNMDVQTDNKDKNEVLLLNYGKECQVPD